MSFLNTVVDGSIIEVNTAIAEGTNLNEINEHGENAAHIASMCKDADIMSLLVEKRVDISCKDNDGWTPLRTATEHDADLVVPVLISARADVNETALQGRHL